MIDSTRIVFFFASIVPMTRTFWPANPAGVFWSLSV